MLQHVAILHSFLWLNNISVYGYTTFGLLVDGHLGVFHLWAIMKNVTMNIHIPVFTWTYVFSFLEYIPKSGIAGSHGSCV